MRLVLGQKIPDWNPDLILKHLVEKGGYESEEIMVSAVYRAKGHDLTKDTAGGIVQSFKCSFIDVMLLAAAGLVKT
jgi:hypothetical protein